MIMSIFHEMKKSSWGQIFVRFSSNIMFILYAKTASEISEKQFLKSCYLLKQKADVIKPKADFSCFQKIEPSTKFCPFYKPAKWISIQEAYYRFSEVLFRDLSYLTKARDQAAISAKVLPLPIYTRYHHTINSKRFQWFCVIIKCVFYEKVDKEISQIQGNFAYWSY